MSPDPMLRALLECWHISGEQHWLPVQGASMRPFLRQGNAILVSHDLADLRLGELLVFQKPDGLVAHRLVRFTRSPGGETLYQTKGDACSYFDAPQPGSAIFGRVVAIRKNGRIIHLTTQGWRLGNRLLASAHLLLCLAIDRLRPFKRLFVNSKP